MSKKSKKKETPAVIPQNRDEKSFDTFKMFLNHINQNKEAYVLLFTAMGLVITTLFNLSCDMWYRGYADALHISIDFISRNNRNLLISLLVFIGVGILLFPIFYGIYQLANNLYIKKIKLFISIAIAAILFASPIELYFFHKTDFVRYNWNWLILVANIISSLSAIFLFIYVVSLCLVREKHKVKASDNATTVEDNTQNTKNTQEVASGTQHEDAHLLALLKATPILAVSLICALMAVYCFGRVYALSLNKYDFIEIGSVPDTVGITQNNNLVLSQTEDNYYLCAYVIEGQEIVIYPERYVVLSKSDDLGLVAFNRMHFSSTQIKTG